MIEIVDPAKAIRHPRISNLCTDYFFSSRHPTITGPDKFTNMTLWDIKVYFPAKIAQYCWSEIAIAAINRFAKFFLSLSALIASNWCRLW
jgi:hypothetical protein